MKIEKNKAERKHIFIRRMPYWLVRLDFDPVSLSLEWVFLQSPGENKTMKSLNQLSTTRTTRFIQVHSFEINI